MRRFIVFALCLLILACSTDSRQEKFTKKNLVELQNKVLSGKDYTPDDIRQFQLGAMAISRSQGGVIGKTVKEIIEEGKKLDRPAKPSGMEFQPEQKLFMKSGTTPESKL